MGRGQQGCAGQGGRDWPQTSSPDRRSRRSGGKDSSWRDYFRGARRLGEADLRAGYISRALLSETEDIWVFGIAAPIYDEGTWAGVLLIAAGTDAALGQQRLDRASDDGPMAARAQDWAREQVTRLCKLAGVPRVTPQGLRGTLATMGREVGNTSQQVADMLGHASPAITERAYIEGGRAAAAARRAALVVLDGGR